MEHICISINRTVSTLWFPWPPSLDLMLAAPLPHFFQMDTHPLRSFNFLHTIIRMSRNLFQQMNRHRLLIVIIMADLLNYEPENMQCAHSFQIHSNGQLNSRHMHHDLSTSWMCWEWLLPGGIKIRSSQPELFSLICIGQRASIQCLILLKN
jgi:hypothetical protein